MKLTPVFYRNYLITQRRFFLAFLSFIFLSHFLIAQDNKKGGICFRFDDNLPKDKLSQVAAVFNKYNYKYCLSLNLDALPDTLEYLNFIRQLDKNGFELMDHCPNHGTEAFWMDRPCIYKNHPGVDHVNEYTPMVSLKYKPIDHSKLVSPGFAKVSSDTVISIAAGEFRNWNSDFYIYFSSLDKLGKPYAAMNKNFNDPDTFLLKSFWTEEVDLGNIPKAKYYFIDHRSVEMTPEAMSVLAQESIRLFAQFGLKRPVTWIQPGSTTPQFTSSMVRAVYGDKFQYTAAATDGGLQCYNDRNENARFSMQWGDFSGGISVVAADKKIIADQIARHYFLIAGCHFWDVPIDWNLYLNRVDSLLSWCYQKKISVKTYHEWANVVYDSPQNPYTNVFPKLNIDLDEDNEPDGYKIVSSRVEKKDVPDSLNDYSLSIAKKGVLCRIHGLAGLESGENEFSIWTKGAPGNFIRVKFHFQESKDSLSFKIPAIERKWTHYSLSQLKNGSQKLIIPQNFTYFHVEISCSDYQSGNVMIGGMELKKKLDSPLYIISSPDTLLFCREEYRYRVVAAKYNTRDRLTFELINSPSWLKIDTMGVITGYRDTEEEKVAIRVKVRDQSGNSAEQVFNLAVREAPSAELAQGKVMCPKPIRKRFLLLIVFGGLLIVAITYVIIRNKRKRSV